MCRNRPFPAGALAAARRPAHGQGMRTISDDVSVRLYHLDDEGGSATTLIYGTLSEALAVAAEQPEALLAGLYLQTSNDVVAYLDYLEG
jgi:hypothetical protein